MKLERLTPLLLKRAEQKGKAAGWHALLLKGYLPDEIAMYAEPLALRNDVIYRVREYAYSKGLPVPVSCAPKSRRPEPVSPSDWRAAFRSSVMRTGMVLSLTQPMLEYLCAVADGVVWDRQLVCGSTQAHPCNSIATGGSLEKRGLIQRQPDFTYNRKDEHASHMMLTEAGEAVIALLKSVGVFVEADAAIAKKAGRK